MLHVQLILYATEEIMLKADAQAGQELQITQSLSIEKRIEAVLARFANANLASEAAQEILANAVIREIKPLSQHEQIIFEIFRRTGETLPNANLESMSLREDLAIEILTNLQAAQVSDFDTLSFSLRLPHLTEAIYNEE